MFRRRKLPSESSLILATNECAATMRLSFQRSVPLHRSPSLGIGKIDTARGIFPSQLQADGWIDARLSRHRTCLAFSRLASSIVFIEGDCIYCRAESATTFRCSVQPPIAPCVLTSRFCKPTSAAMKLTPNGHSPPCCLGVFPVAGLLASDDLSVDVISTSHQTTGREIVPTDHAGPTHPLMDFLTCRFHEPGRWHSRPEIPSHQAARLVETSIACSI